RERDALLELAAGRLALHARARIGGLLTERRSISFLASRFVERRMLAERALPELIDAEVARDRVDPRGEPRLVLEVRRVLDDADEGLLDDVLGHLRDTHLAEGEVEERLLMAADQGG